MEALLRTFIHAVALLVVFSFSVEAVARVDDLFRRGVPMWSTPDRVADLVVQDALGIRGKPYGHYKRWTLNRFGFRGPDIAEEPRAGCARVVTLGASETFGLYESDGHEYPAQLAGLLHDAGCYEVINASIFGLTVPDIDKTWKNWVSRFRPAVVTIYVTPSFYLAPSVPTAATNTTVFTRPPWWQPRALERARDVIDYPEFVQRRLVERTIRQIDDSHEAGWFFRGVPPDRLERYERDIAQLAGDVKATAARVILITHANGFGSPVRPDEGVALEQWRTLLARPTTDALLAFEPAAREAMKRVGAEQRVEVLDLAAHLNGARQAFADDLLHFNDEGARQVASLIRDAILSKGPN